MSEPRAGVTGAVRHTGDVSQPVQPQPSIAPAHSGTQPWGTPPAPPTQFPWRRAIPITVAVFLVAGAVAGWAWQRFSPLAQYTVDKSGAALGEEQMTKIFGPDGTFVSIGFVAALVLGGLLFWWLHTYGPWAVAVVVLGSALGSGVAWGVGMLLGHNPLQPRLEAAKPGDLLAAPLQLHTWTPLVAWVIGAALAAAVIAASTWRSEPAPEASPPA
jgi:MFS family permease